MVMSLMPQFLFGRLPGFALQSARAEQARRISAAIPGAGLASANSLYRLKQEQAGDPEKQKSGRIHNRILLYSPL